MSTEQFILTIIGAFGAVWGLYKVLAPRILDAKISGDEYERARAAFREDATFDLLKDTLEHWKKSHEEERAETAEARKYQIELMQSINKMTNSLDNHTDVIRLLVQQVAVFDDSLKTTATENAAKTRTLRDGE